jgi:hypothetical protein
MKELKIVFLIAVLIGIMMLATLIAVAWGWSNISIPPLNHCLFVQVLT